MAAERRARAAAGSGRATNGRVRRRCHPHPPLRTARARCPACRSRRLTGCDAWAGSWAMACGMAPWAVRSVVTAPGVHGDEGMERDRLPSEPGGSTPRTWPTLGFGSPRARAACGHAVTIPLPSPPPTPSSSPPTRRGWPRRSAVVHALWDPSGGGAPAWSCGTWGGPPGRTVSALAFPASHPTRPGGRQPPGRVGLSTCLGGPIPSMTGWPALPPTASTPWALALLTVRRAGCLAGEASKNVCWFPQRGTAWQPSKPGVAGRPAECPGEAPSPLAPLLAVQQTTQHILAWSHRHARPASAPRPVLPLQESWRLGGVLRCVSTTVRLAVTRTSSSKLLVIPAFHDT